jgi:hypothetical protein
MHNGGGEIVGLMEYLAGILADIEPTIHFGIGDVAKKNAFITLGRLKLRTRWEVLSEQVSNRKQCHIQ